VTPKEFGNSGADIFYSNISDPRMFDMSEEGSSDDDAYSFTHLEAAAERHRDFYCK
jgi:hypothetical protein